MKLEGEAAWTRQECCLSFDTFAGSHWNECLVVIVLHMWLCDADPEMQTQMPGCLRELADPGGLASPGDLKGTWAFPKQASPLEPMRPAHPLHGSQRGYSPFSVTCYGKQGADWADLTWEPSRNLPGLVIHFSFFLWVVCFPDLIQSGPRQRAEPAGSGETGRWGGAGSVG